jgi:hypothetical protein
LYLLFIGVISPYYVSGKKEGLRNYLKRFLRHVVPLLLAGLIVYSLAYRLLRLLFTAVMGPDNTLAPIPGDLTLSVKRFAYKIIPSTADALAFSISLTPLLYLYFYGVEGVLRRMDTTASAT